MQQPQCNLQLSANMAGRIAPAFVLIVFCLSSLCQTQQEEYGPHIRSVLQFLSERGRTPVVFKKLIHTAQEVRKTAICLSCTQKRTASRMGVHYTFFRLHFCVRTRNVEHEHVPTGAETWNAVCFWTRDVALSFWQGSYLKKSYSSLDAL